MVNAIRVRGINGNIPLHDDDLANYLRTHW
jgi:hypothetical protein